jgi:hypothetical protein
VIACAIAVVALGIASGPILEAISFASR